MDSFSVLYFQLGDEDMEKIIQVTKGINEFAFRFSKELAKGKENTNYINSPFSVWLPLAALISGTDKRYQEELLNSLCINGLTDKEINEAVYNVLSKLADRENINTNHYFSTLQIANAFFVDNRVTLKEKFVELFKTYFDGKTFNVDFNSSEAVDSINKWASDNTDGLIDNIVNEFDKDTVAAIANAIYFSDRWHSEFNPELNINDKFYGSLKEAEVEYMVKESDFKYYEDDNVQAVKLEFVHGSGMYILLPKDKDAHKLITSLEPDYFNKILEESTLYQGKLQLPKFSVKSDVMDLKETLKNTGVPLFDDPVLTEVIEEYDLFISSAVQKAYIEVDEKGTTAAAVTVMGMAKMSMPIVPAETFEMKCDSPFVFVLTGNTGISDNLILFMGMVNNLD